MRTLVCSLSLLLASAVSAQTAPPFDWQGEYSQVESMPLKLCKRAVVSGAGLRRSREHRPADPIRGQSDRRVGCALAPLDGGGQLMVGGKW